ncbi:carbon-nitrogen hydrolase family protein [Caproicibacter fermentans]|uniref:Carbon-nitrogen hydrolase family protein n=1 Tax=Caproicibacter fermentans TaxID=2576756 RepID=A0A7G8TE70_9FIRM|nr:carbon-nitrogen hydrolase family protein [Caproicibacter fermentans]QNK41911.1 carbon-nitrogen hydrolase family protein [Caproicibacter fermentans]
MNGDVLTVSVVTMNAAWGQKEQNLNRIKGFIECAGKRGSDMVILPEMVLTGYDDVAETPKEEKMQARLAETIPGPATDEIAEMTRRYGVYAFLGMPERSPEGLYNSMAIFSPEGLCAVYRKIHLPQPEPNWALRGEEPVLVETPWGPVGVSICFDSYYFPELMRYYVAKGARLIVNCTAHAHCHGRFMAKASLEVASVMNGVFIASSNLGGPDLTNWFWGGSSIVGPSRNKREPHYYAGIPFYEDGCDEEGMYTATIDLGLATRFLVQNNEAGYPDFRPDLYSRLYSELAQTPPFCK